MTKKKHTPYIAQSSDENVNNFKEKAEILAQPNSVLL
jgi:hypothetical protein